MTKQDNDKTERMLKTVYGLCEGNVILLFINILVFTYLFIHSFIHLSVFTEALFSVTGPVFPGTRSLTQETCFSVANNESFYLNKNKEVTNKWKNTPFL